MRALYTSTSSILAQQSKLDVISNNLANLNTTGFKAKNTQFAELLRTEFPQIQDKPGLAQGRLTPDGLRLGNGVMAAYLAQQLTQGNLQNTGNMLDLAVEGEGFFQVQVPVPGQQGQSVTAFSRDGKFSFDADGYLVNSDGYKVVGDDDRPIQIQNPDLRGLPVSISPNGQITVSSPAGPNPVGTIRLVLVKNAEANLQPVGDNLYRHVDPNFNPANNSLPNLNGADRDRAGSIRQGMLEMSNVDTAAEMSDMIQVQRALQLSSRSVQTIDSMMGMANNLRA